VKGAIIASKRLQNHATLPQRKSLNRRTDTTMVKTKKTNRQTTI